MYINCYIMTNIYILLYNPSCRENERITHYNPEAVNHLYQHMTITPIWKFMNNINAFSEAMLIIR